MTRAELEAVLADRYLILNHHMSLAEAAPALATKARKEAQKAVRVALRISLLQEARISGTSLIYFAVEGIPNEKPR